MRYRNILAIFLWLLPLLIQAQTDTTQVDTTSSGYKIGYQIGSWLPFIILIGLLIFFTVRAARSGKEHPG